MYKDFQKKRMLFLFFGYHGKNRGNFSRVLTAFSSCLWRVPEGEEQSGSQAVSAMGRGALVAPNGSKHLAMVGLVAL